MMNDSLNMVQFAKAMADETRQEILTQCCCVWMNVNDLVAAMEGKVNQPTVSHHLKKLEEAGLVEVRQEGRKRFYTVNQDRFNQCCMMLAQSFAPDMVNVDDIKVDSPDS